MSNVTAQERPKNAQPWTNRGPRVRLSSTLTIAVPSAVFGLILLLTGMDFMAGLFTIFLPMQLLFGAAAGYYSYGKRGVTDGLLLVVTFFLSLFVFVLLASVLWSVIESGFQALSPHFIYQNNVYVSGKTGLVSSSFGGFGAVHLLDADSLGIQWLLRSHGLACADPTYAPYCVPCG